MAWSPFIQGQKTTEMRKKILVHVTQGPDNPSRAAVAFLVATTAIEEGHDVTFLAADSVRLIRTEVLDHLTGLGTATLREHFDGM